MLEFEKELNVCKNMKDDTNRAKCMADLSHKVARLQESVWIPALNESIALSNSLINHANALILEATRWKGDIRKQVEFGYTFEKVNSIVNDWNAMAHDYNISHEMKFPLLIVEQKKEFPDKWGHTPDKETIKLQNEFLFKKQI